MSFAKSRTGSQGAFHGVWVCDQTWNMHDLDYVWSLFIIKNRWTGRTGFFLFLLFFYNYFREGNIKFTTVHTLHGHFIRNTVLISPFRISCCFELFTKRIGDVSSTGFFSCQHAEHIRNDLSGKLYVPHMWKEEGLAWIWFVVMSHDQSWSTSDENLCLFVFKIAIFSKYPRYLKSWNID